jgi:nucleotide sugar dehydrogenase
MSKHIVQIGLGVVGFAYFTAFKNKGFKVSGIEYSKELVNKYKEDFDVYHVDDDMNKLVNVDFILISVCTPLKGTALDMSYLFSTIDNVAVIVKNNPEAFVVIRSTVIPLACNEYKEKLDNILINIKAKVCFQPEFLRAVSAVEDALHPWYVLLSAIDDIDMSPLVDLYSNFIDVSKIKQISIEEAELMKIFHNSFNANKISFFNQCHLLCEKINEKHNKNLDMNRIAEVMTYTCEGLINRRYGTKTGHSYANECLPKDSAELAKLEEEYNLDSKLFKSIVDVNNEMRLYEKKNNIPIVLNGDFHMSFDVMTHDAKL